MALKIKLAVALCLVFSVAHPVAGQSGRKRPAPNASRERVQRDTLRLRAEEVLLPVSVRSTSGKLPDKLDRTDFIVTEDGKRQEVTAVLRTPANVLLILDTSGDVLTRKNVNLHRDLALRLIDSLGDGDRAALVSYGEKVNLLSPWTSDKKALRGALDWSYRPGIESRLYDALVYATEEVLPKVTGRRSVVIMSDGVDSFHESIFEKALAAFHRTRATVYVVSPNAVLLKELKPRIFNILSWYERLDKDSRKRIDHQRRYYRRLEAAEVTLKGLAEETGGLIWNPESRIECKTAKAGIFLPRDTKKDDDPSVDCETIKDSIVAEISTEYVIAYSSERQPDDAGFHLIKVFPTKPAIQVRSRRGIYSNLSPPKAREAKP